jgi:hypothetical protein
MRRRHFIAGLTGLTATLPFASRAQQGDRMRRLGVLMSFAEDDPGMAAEMAALRQGLAEGAGLRIGRLKLSSGGRAETSSLLKQWQRKWLGQVQTCS